MTDKSCTGNSCGSCAVCCFALDVRELGKPAGVMCEHCTGTGCGIYETRYQICRTFHCGWRLVPQLGEEWRPDRSGVLILYIEAKDVPEKYRAQGNGMNFVILGGQKAILRPGFAEYVSVLVSRDVAVYLSADSAKTLINTYLRERVAAKDKAAVIEMLLHIYNLHLKWRETSGRKMRLPCINLI